MRKKAQINLGVLLMAFIGIIVGLALFGTIASNIAQGTKTITIPDGSYQITAPADGETIDLRGQEYISDFVALNHSEGQTITATNYTVDEGVSTTSGLKTIRYTAVGSELDGDTLNLSYVYGPDGYIDNSGGRAIAGIIVIFAALVIASVALVPALRSEVMNLIGK